MALSITHIRRRNFQGLIVTILIALIATVAINLVIDPYGTFRFFDIPGLNHIKPYPDHDLETIKAHALLHVKPDALILGNSRAEVGLDPTHPAWREAGYQTVYNAAIAGAGTKTAVILLEHTAQIKPPKLILLGIDFFDFPITPDFEPNQPISNNNPTLINLRWMLHATLTMQALLDSATTLRRQYQNNPEQMTTLGHNPLLEYEDIAKADGYWVLFRQRIEDNVKNHGRKPKNLYIQGTHSSPRFEDIRRIVRWTVQNNAELRLIVYPYHAQLLVMIDELGLWPVFEEWKRQIVKIVYEEMLNLDEKTRIRLIDFSKFHEFSRETIPPKGDKIIKTTWYWEAGHFKKELGNKILNCCIFQDTITMSEEFAVALDYDNLETTLEAERNEKTMYITATPVMRVEVSEIVRRIKPPTNPPQRDNNE